MAWRRGIWHGLFITTPLVAGVVGYHYQGWLAVLVFPIAAVFLLGLVLVASLIISVWMKYLSDRARVSRLTTEQLHSIVTRPANVDFRFAFMELATRGIDTNPAQQLLLVMLTSKDGRERDLGLERLRQIYPEIRRAIPVLFVDPPESLRSQVEGILARVSTQG
jgi:hypothetical protein